MVILFCIFFCWGGGACLFFILIIYIVIRICFNNYSIQYPLFSLIFRRQASSLCIIPFSSGKDDRLCAWLHVFAVRCLGSVQFQWNRRLSSLIRMEIRSAVRWMHRYSRMRPMLCVGWERIFWHVSLSSSLAPAAERWQHTVCRQTGVFTSTVVSKLVCVWIAGVRAHRMELSTHTVWPGKGKCSLLMETECPWDWSRQQGRLICCSLLLSLCLHT